MSDETAITIKDVMTPEVHTIDRTATVREAVRKMRDAGISSIIVERRDESDEYGLVAVTDIAADVIARNHDQADHDQAGGNAGPLCGPHVVPLQADPLPGHRPRAPTHRHRHLARHGAARDRG